MAIEDRSVIETGFPGVTGPGAGASTPRPGMGAYIRDIVQKFRGWIGRPARLDISLDSKADQDDAPLHYDREPTAARDSSSLYADGDHWISPTRAYRAYASGDGVTWQGNSLRPRLPLDSIRVAPAVAFGWVRLADSYGGYCCRISRASDGASLDVGFAGNVVDLVAISAFAGREMVFMERMYRQDGSGGFVGAAGPDRPIVSPFAMMGPCPALISQNTICSNGRANPRQSIALPDGLSLDLANHSVVIAGMFSHSARDIPVLELTSADGYGLGIGNRDQPGIHGLGLVHGPRGTSTPVMADFMAHIGPMVIGYDSAPGGLTLHASDRRTVTAAALPSHTMNAGQLGNCTRFFTANDHATLRQGGMMYGAVIIFPQALSVDDGHALRLATEFILQMRPQVRGNVILDGDSIHDGVYDRYFQSIARRMAPLLTRPSNIYLSAIAGGTWHSQISTFSRKVMPCLDAKAPYNILVTSLGTNDLGAVTPEDCDRLWASATTYASKVTASGVTDWLVMPVRPRLTFVGSDKETQRQAFNARLASSHPHLGAQAVVDVNLIAEIQDPADRLYFQPDGTHFQDTQRALEASFCADALNAYAVSRAANR